MAARSAKPSYVAAPSRFRSSSAATPYRRRAGDGDTSARQTMLLAADPADGWALPVADAVELLHVDELPVHTEPGELRDDIPVRVVVAGTGGALVVDGPVLSDQLQRSRESRGAGIHWLSLAVVDGSHRVADHGARHLIRVLELVLMDGLERREHQRHRRVAGGGVAERRSLAVKPLQ